MRRGALVVQAAHEIAQRCMIGMSIEPVRGGDEGTSGYGGDDLAQ
jgi:hypothetical protein